MTAVASPSRSISTTSVSSIYSPTHSSPGPSISIRGKPSREASFASSSASYFGSFKRDRLLSNASSIRTVRLSDSKTSDDRKVKKQSGGQNNVRQPTPLGAHPHAIDLMRLSLAPNDTSQNEAQAGNDIDNLFVAFSIRDVRAVEERARDEADKKKEDLRTMVGERYRDLLSAADSILRMRKSSTTLLKGLSWINRDCSREHMANKALSYHSPKAAQASTEEITLSSPYTLATLVKLLLDCPEYIWRALEQGDYLSAARLEGLGRIIYRELVSAGEKQEDEVILSTFPLIEKHWESLSQLNPQIVKRAKASLRDWQTSAFYNGQALSAIVLLENIPLNETLDLLLSTRLAALERAIDTAHDSSSSESTKIHLLSSLSLLVATLEHAHILYSVGESTDPMDGLLLQILHRLGQNFTALTTPSQPFDPLSANIPSHIPPILHTVPNMHLLLHYLPHSIISFTPYIDVQNKITKIKLDEAIDNWFKEASLKVMTGLQNTLGTIEQANQLASLHEAVESFLTTSSARANQDNLGRLRQEIKSALEMRLSEVVSFALKHISDTFNNTLYTAMKNLSQSPEDTQPANFIFSPHTSSLFSSSSLGTVPGHNNTMTEADRLRHHQAPFVSYLSSINRRICRRSPFIDQCLSIPEKEAKRLMADLMHWVPSDDHGKVHSMYEGQYRKWCERLFSGLKELMDASLKDIGQVLFICRIITALLDDQSFVQSLALVDSQREANAGDLESLRTKALNAWHMDALQVAQLQAREAVDALVSAETLSKADLSQALPADPSHRIFAALFSLVQSVQRLDILASEPLTTTLLSAFSNAHQEYVSKCLEEKHVALEQSAAVQLYYDLAFLKAIRAFDSDNNELIFNLIQKGNLSQDQQEEIAERNKQHMKRLQNLFDAFLDVPTEIPNGTKLLLLGPSVALPPKQANHAVVVIKPGLRFQLLPVSE